jgi:hypothetical protein
MKNTNPTNINVQIRHIVIDNLPVVFINQYSILRKQYFEIASGLE